MTIKFDGRVAIVTGAGRGLGRAHALAFARHGARVVVNDMPEHSSTQGESAADSVVREIRELGGQAVLGLADVTDPKAVHALVANALSQWGRVDAVVCNAGAVRDASFGKMSASDFSDIFAIHVNGATNFAKAAWETMRAQQYGRLLLTSSSSGLYGNFGQANYGAAKAAMVGLMNVLRIEGDKYNIRVNTLVPAARTRMTESLLDKRAAQLLQPESVSPAALFLCSEGAPSGVIMAAGAGCFSRIRIVETEGIYLHGAALTPDNVAGRFDELSDRSREVVLAQAWDQTRRFVERAERFAANHDE